MSLQPIRLMTFEMSIEAGQATEHGASAQRMHLCDSRTAEIESTTDSLEICGRTGTVSMTKLSRWCAKRGARSDR
jgi:hypothetical protein